MTTTPIDRNAEWRRKLSFTNLSVVYILIALVIIFGVWKTDLFLTYDTLQRNAQPERHPGADGAGVDHGPVLWCLRPLHRLRHEPDLDDDGLPGRVRSTATSYRRMAIVIALTVALRPD